MSCLMILRSCGLRRCIRLSFLNCCSCCRLNKRNCHCFCYRLNRKSRCFWYLSFLNCCGKVQNTEQMRMKILRANTLTNCFRCCRFW